MKVGKYNVNRSQFVIRHFANADSPQHLLITESIATDMSWFSVICQNKNNHDYKHFTRNIWVLIITISRSVMFMYLKDDYSFEK